MAFDLPLPVSPMSRMWLDSSLRGIQKLDGSKPHFGYNRSRMPFASRVRFHPNAGHQLRPFRSPSVTLFMFGLAAKPLPDCERQKDQNTHAEERREHQPNHAFALEKMLLGDHSEVSHMVGSGENKAGSTLGEGIGREI